MISVYLWYTKRGGLNMKKTVFSFLVAGALLVTGPLASSAAQSDSSNNVYENRYVISVNNDSDWNKIIQNILNKYYSGHYQSQDRKSTRLNSSHVKSSYAVFCLKKK